MFSAVSDDNLYSDGRDKPVDNIDNFVIITLFVAQT